MNIGTSPHAGNVPNTSRFWEHSKRLLAPAIVALGTFCCCASADAAEPGENAAASAPDVAEPESGSPDAPVFVGNSELRARLDAPGKLRVAGERLHDKLVRHFYEVHGYQTIWDQHPAEASRLWKGVMRAGEHGLDPHLFHAAILGERAPSLTLIERDLVLSDAFLSYADALSRGAIPIEDRLDDEDLTPEPVDVVAVLDAAIVEPDPARLIEALAPSSTEYGAMRRAYAEYRAIADGGEINVRSRKVSQHGSEESRALAEKRARQLAINLERLRWLPRHIPPDRVVVNSAIARLQLFRSDRPVFTTRVVVGEIDKQTPELQSTINDVLFNPPWNIPHSIVQQEILPKLAADPNFLSRHHMRWRAGGSIQQEAGPYSALGRLKFEMTDRYDVYLHDTPTRSLFQSPERMMSHGCVRVENPRVLAGLLLEQGPEAIDKGIAHGTTTRRTLPAPFPIFIVYQTTYLESDNSIQFRPDPYERDDEIWQHLIRWQQPTAHESASGQRKG
jgi:L,D-transpeptidase YcbB